MKWTEPNPPTVGESYYDHVTCKTPLGLMKIEWKSWKERPSYSVEIDDKYIDNKYSLGNAKLVAYAYLLDINEKLDKFLEL